MSSFDQKAGIVYIITNLVNGQIYVGKTVMLLIRRWQNHVAQAKRGCSMPITRAIKKYGAENFSIREVSRHLSNEEACLEEIRLIAELSPHYNITAGGEGTLGAVRSPESRAKLSASLKKYYAVNPNAMKGATLSEETRLRMSAATRGRKKTIKDPLWKEKHEGSLVKARAKKRVAVRCLYDGRIWPSYRDAANYYGVNETCIAHHLLRNGKSKTVRGLTFEKYGP